MTAIAPEDHDPLSVEEVTRRLPPIRMLPDDLQPGVIELSRNAPDYFWEVRATSGPDVDYHHPIARREPHGLWAHTLMLFGPLMRLSQTYMAQGEITEQERDYAIAAALLHDQRKRGPHGSTKTSAVSDHDLQMTRVIEESDLPMPARYEIADAVAAHMGPSEWGYDGPEPETPVQQLVHHADMIASTPNVDVRIPGPVPKELAAMGLEAGDF